ncbi:MAG: two-component system, cell cycle response regulator DivK, partial [Candidatus Magnetoglobus multicellularis str. Araruama]
MLIVDDNMLNRQFFVQMLKRNKFELFEAEDGFQAIDMTQKHRPHLILMDIMMPKMSGTEAIAEIRKIPENNKIVIFAVSANAEMKDICKKTPNSCNEFLLKPLDLNLFYTKLCQYFDFAVSEDTDPNNELSEKKAQLIPPDPSDLKEL